MLHLATRNSEPATRNSEGVETDPPYVPLSVRPDAGPDGRAALPTIGALGGRTPRASGLSVGPGGTTEGSGRAEGRVRHGVGRADDRAADASGVRGSGEERGGHDLARAGAGDRARRSGGGVGAFRPGPNAGQRRDPVDGPHRELGASGRVLRRRGVSGKCGRSPSARSPAGSPARGEPSTIGTAEYRTGHTDPGDPAFVAGEPDRGTPHRPGHQGERRVRGCLRQARIHSGRARGPGDAHRCDHRARSHPPGERRYPSCGGEAGDRTDPHRGCEAGRAGQHPTMLEGSGGVHPGTSQSVGMDA